MYIDSRAFRPNHIYIYIEIVWRDGVPWMSNRSPIIPRPPCRRMRIERASPDCLIYLKPTYVQTHTLDHEMSVSHCLADATIHEQQCTYIHMYHATHNDHVDRRMDLCTNQQPTQSSFRSHQLYAFSYDLRWPRCSLHSAGAITSAKRMFDGFRYWNMNDVLVRHFQARWD